MDHPNPQQPYLDSPTSSRSPSPTPHTSPSSSDSSTTIKPLPPLPVETSTYTSNEPYRDEPTTNAPYHDEPFPPSRYRHAQTHDPSYRDVPSYHTSNRFEQRDTDSSPLTPNDDNIPLAHFLSGQYPSEAPPSYSVAVRSTHISQDTLIQYIPGNEYTLPRNLQQPINDQFRSGPRNVVVEIDEETGEVVSRTDDVRHGVEKVVAMLIVAIVLLVLGGVLAWMAFGGKGW